MRNLTLLTLFLVAAMPWLAGAEDPALTKRQLATAKQLMEMAEESNEAYNIVESLTTEIGPRLAGSEAEARARDWAVKKLRAMGFANVRVEKFEVPFWIRGVEQAEIVSPFPQPLAITTLGGSASTGPEGVTGELVAFKSLAALKARADDYADGKSEDSLAGKLVFVDETMTRTQDGSGYGVAVAKRRSAAYEAERLGALGVLIRSVGTSSHRFPHTGQMRSAIQEGAPGAPAAALSAPDADQLQRALKRGPVKVRLVLTPEALPPAESGNVVAELVGSERPEEIVLVGAHLDSWDLGTGAIDDGAGVGIVVAATKLLMEQLPTSPKRTIRVVLFGSEEVGLVGAKAYAERYADDLDQHIVGTESDFGAGRIWRFDTRVGEDALPAMAEIAEALRPLGIGPGHKEATGGPDMFFVRKAGVPVVTLGQNGWDYFDLHHTPNDTLDKIDPEALSQNVAAYAAFLYLVADTDASFR